MTVVKLGTTLLKQLVQRGLPRDIVRHRDFNTEHHAYTIMSASENMRVIKVNKSVQLQEYDEVLRRPFSSPYLYIISSGPNDAKAKQAAAHIMEVATAGQLAGKFPKSTRGKTSPRWHVVNGSFRDDLRDKNNDDPSMLIISNVTSDSTNVKIEKVRDLLEQFNGIPRILVISGEDPITFANRKLYMSVNPVMQLHTARKTIL